MSAQAAARDATARPGRLGGPQDEATVTAVGRSTVKRPAMSDRSDDCQSPTGNLPIIRAKAWVAAILGKPAKRPASFQGSRPSRARAETTVRTMPFLSSPTGAKRNALNSILRGENEWPDPTCDHMGHRARTINRA